jgi:putative hydrolase of the HAD superfamily
MYKALIFDVGKVLIPFDFKLGYQALERLSGLTVPEIRQRIAATGLVMPFEKGLIETSEFVERLSAALGLNSDYGGFCHAWSCIFHDQLIPDATLAALSGTYRLLLLSNTNFLHFEMIRKNYSSLLEHFHDRILSFEVHAAKPEPEIFQAAIRRAGCRAEECFFTDDLAENVEAARREGMDAVQFESAEQLEREMRARGIVWSSPSGLPPGFPSCGPVPGGPAPEIA